MTAQEYREKVNLGCSMPSVDRQYACHLESESDITDFIAPEEYREAKYSCHLCAQYVDNIGCSMLGAENPYTCPLEADSASEDSE